MTIDYGEICKTFHCGTAWRGNFPAEIVFSTSTMWRMELSVVWMVATGKLQYPLQKPVSSLSQTVIGDRKRFHLCFGFQFWQFLFYKCLCRIQQILNSAVVSPKLKWIGEWKNHRYDRTSDVIWILEKYIYIPAVDYENKLHLILFVYWIISPVSVMVQVMCTRSAKQNNSAIK